MHSQKEKGTDIKKGYGDSPFRSSSSFPSSPFRHLANDRLDDDAREEKGYFFSVHFISSFPPSLPPLLTKWSGEGGGGGAKTLHFRRWRRQSASGLPAKGTRFATVWSFARLCLPQSTPSMVGESCAEAFKRKITRKKEGRRSSDTHKRRGRRKWRDK